MEVALEKKPPTDDMSDLEKVYQPRTAEEIADLCARLNCDLIVATDHTLLLDLDTPEAVVQFNNNRGVVEALFKFDKVESWLSRNGNTHMLVTLVEPITDFCGRMLLQAALGSDGKREAMSWSEHLAGHPTPNVLFRPRLVETLPTSMTRHESPF